MINHAHIPSIQVLEDKSAIVGVKTALENDGVYFGEWKTQALATLSATLDRPNSFVVVGAAPDGGLKGISTGYIDREDATVWWTILSKDTRGTGFSEEMCKQSAQFLASKGVTMIHTIGETEAGKKLLTRQGFWTRDGSHFSKYIGT